MKITKQQLKQIIKEELENITESRAFDYDPDYGGSGTVPGGETKKAELREPWDGIEENANMISDNAIKIEYLARKLGIEIPIDPKL